MKVKGSPTWLFCVCVSALLYYNPLWAHTGRGSCFPIEPGIGLHGVVRGLGTKHSSNRRKLRCASSAPRRSLGSRLPFPFVLWNKTTSCRHLISAAVWPIQEFLQAAAYFNTTVDDRWYFMLKSLNLDVFMPKILDVVSVFYLIKSLWSSILKHYETAKTLVCL